ncbi:MAG: GGDEF domain-containing protein [Vicinamibacterales bacterium]
MAMPPAAVAPLALAAVVVIAAVDVLAGPRLPFSPLFTAPVVAAGWMKGWRVAAAVAAAATAARVASELAVSGFHLQVLLSAVIWGAALGLLARGAAWTRARTEEIAGLEARVNELAQIEHSFALTDPLTSLNNRRAFVDTLQRAEARGRRSGSPLAVVRIDLDGFAAVNSAYSRQEGDQLLRAVATSLSLTTRMGDLASRLEADEFALLLYHCAPDDALRVGQRIVDEVAELGRGYGDARVTASVGVACFAPPGPDPDEMMRLAGAALHRARQAGGNTVMIEREWSPDQLRELRPMLQPPDASRPH